MSTIPMSAKAILDREFLEIRAKILELAASLDRLDRGEGTVEEEPRFQLITRGLQTLLSKEFERAEELQLIFSRHYQQDWSQEFGLDIEVPADK